MVTVNSTLGLLLVKKMRLVMTGTDDFLGFSYATILTHLINKQEFDKVYIFI